MQTIFKTKIIRNGWHNDAIKKIIRKHNARKVATSFEDLLSYASIEHALRPKKAHGLRMEVSETVQGCLSVFENEKLTMQIFQVDSINTKNTTILVA